MKKTVWVAFAACLLGGCATNPDGTQSVNKTAVGAAVGAVAGGLLGNQIDRDGNRDRGTFTGAIAGAAAGAGVGYVMDRQEKELRKELENERQAHQIEVERVRDDLLKLTLDSEVSFDFDSAAIKPAFQPSLTKLANVLAKYDRNQVTVVGHTDSTGSESYNQDLSLRRAQAVMDELAKQGVPSFAMTAEGRGEIQPRADNTDEAGRQLNRRVEIFVQPDDTTA